MLLKVVSGYMGRARERDDELAIAFGQVLGMLHDRMLKAFPHGAFKEGNDSRGEVARIECKSLVC